MICLPAHLLPFFGLEGQWTHWTHFYPTIQGFIESQMVQWISKTSTVFSGRPLPRQLWSLYSYFNGLPSFIQNLSCIHYSHRSSAFRLIHTVPKGDILPLKSTEISKDETSSFALLRRSWWVVDQLRAKPEGFGSSTRFGRHEVGDSSRILKKNPLSVWHHIWIIWVFLMHTIIIVDSCCCFCFASCCLLVTRIHKIYIG